MNDWICVKDKLPGIRESICFVFADGQIFGDEIWFDLSSQEWMENSGMDYYGTFGKNVTHWMKYPDPPIN